ncbi:uncharacterized protein LOC129267421 [Lytechinus pictus]|uniref:uncharacterized protein LOC129267421 n=1 Tax=Lytechinus pictus TaxID=7653 RepID=UPI0030B9DD0A
MTITNSQIDDEGRYKCFSGPLETDVKELKVEVQSTSSLTIGSAIADDADVYIATCRATGGRPQETLTLMLGDDPAPCDGFLEYTLPADAGFSSKEIVCTFPATRENYGETLKCVISGHDVSALNGEITENLEMHNRPCNDIVTVTFESLDPNLRVTCAIDAANQPFPAIRHYFIYANDILKHESSTGINFVALTESEYDLSTEFECVAGNYLGNTASGKKTYGPQKTTEKLMTSHPTTEYEEAIAGKLTTSHAKTDYEGETTSITSEPTCTPCPRSLTGLRSGASAGIAILAILLVVSIIINIVQFVLLRRRTKPEFDGSKMNEKG